VRLARERLLRLAVVAWLLPTVVLGWLVFERQRRLEGVREERATLERMIRTHAGHEDDPTAVAAAYAALPWVLRAESEAVAAADAQGLAGRRVADAGGDLLSVRVGEMEPGDPRRLSLEVRLLGDHRVLRDLLHALEYRRPAFLVDRLQVQGEENGEVLRIDLGLSMFVDLTEAGGEKGG